MNTKSQGLPITTIVIAALGLAVLLVLIIMFTYGSANFSKSTLTCESKGGQCTPQSDCQYQKTSFTCPKKEDICCINPLSG